MASVAIAELLEIILAEDIWTTITTETSEALETAIIRTEATNEELAPLIPKERIPTTWEKYNTFQKVKAVAGVATAAEGILLPNQIANIKKPRSDKGISRGRNKATDKKLNIIKNKLEQSGINNNKNSKKNNTPNIDINNNMPGRSINTGNHGLNVRTQDEEEIPIVQPPKNLSNIVPDYFTIKMKCRYHHTLTLTTGAYASTRINMNNLNSPFSSFTGLDYLGLSQWKALFSFYRILANDITVNIKNVTESSDMAGSGDRLWDGITRTTLEYTDAGTSRLQTARQMAESKHNVTTVLDPIGYGNGNYNHTFTHHYEPQQFINKNSHITQNGDEERWTSVSSAPTHQHYCHVGAVVNGDAVAAGSNIILKVDMICEATVQFREVLDTVLTTSQSS